MNRPPFRAKPVAPLERHEMLVLAQYLDVRGFLWLHPPNEAKRSARQGADLKRLGLKPGAPDVLIFDAPRGLHGVVGVAIELKRRGATPSATSQEQRQWLTQLQMRGWKTAVCAGADAAIKFVEDLYGG